MKLLPKVLVVLGMVIIVSAQAKADNILYFVDGNNGTDQMAAALATLSGDTITLASGPTDFATKIAGGTYNLGIFSAQESYGSDYSAALAALGTFVAGGGNAIVDSWFTPQSLDIAAFDAAFTGAVNGPAINLSAFNSEVTNPVTLTNPIPPYATFSDGLTALSGGTVAATFFDPGNASGTNGQGAIIVGNGGRSIVNGFLNDTAGAPGEQIYINEIDGLLAPPIATPEPSSVLMLGTGLFALGMMAFRRGRLA